MSDQKNLQWKYQRRWTFVIGLIIFSLLLTSCGGLGSSQPKTYTIGMVREGPFMDPIFDGFKAKMTELGYVEGKNITYIHPDIMGSDPQKSDTEIKRLVDQKIDLVLTLGSTPTKSAKKIVEGTNIPVVFVPFLNPVEEGLVDSISHPGGNLTGIQTVNNVPKALEWLLKIAPGTKQVYAPYSPADIVAQVTIKPLPEVAKQLGIDLILDPITSADQEAAAIKALPKDSAIFFLPSPALNPTTGDMKKLAIELGIPSGMRDPNPTDVVFTSTTDAAALGQQAAVMVDKIFKGAKPGDLPIETTEFFLIINLKTAKAIGLNIPDEILNQAQKIIR